MGTGAAIIGPQGVPLLDDARALAVQSANFIE